MPSFVRYTGKLNIIKYHLKVIKTAKIGKRYNQVPHFNVNSIPCTITELCMLLISCLTVVENHVVKFFEKRL